MVFPFLVENFMSRVWNWILAAILLLLIQFSLFCFVLVLLDYFISGVNLSAKFIRESRPYFSELKPIGTPFTTNGSHYHDVYRVEAVGLKKYNILEKLEFLWICEILSNFLKNRYFANNFLINFRITEFFFTYVTHIIVNILRTANFVSVKLIVS